MVLAELGKRLSGALKHLNVATVVDEKVLDECLEKITHALRVADVNLNLISDLKLNVKKNVDFHNLCPGHNKRKIIEQAVRLELCNMLDAGKPSFTPKKGKTNVVMLVGLQGSGKTTTCTKYAHYYHNKGWKPAVICADTFRAGAFDQLKQNSTKAQIPYYGSYKESDPVKIVVEGLERFKSASHDLIVIDTSGRHKQEAALFEEMRQLVEAAKPDLVIFVMDGSIGQAAFDQAQAFKQSVGVGAVIITKLDGHAKGGGALSAVAATKSPVIFIGTGEQVNKFEPFEPESFVARLLGKCDFTGLSNQLHEIVPKYQQSQLMNKIINGEITLRIMQSIWELNALEEVSSFFPASGSVQKNNDKAKIERYKHIMKSMTKKELDSKDTKLMNGSRIMRIARGAGCDVREVVNLLEDYKCSEKMVNNMKGLMMTPVKGRRGSAPDLTKFVPRQMLNEMCGIDGLQSLLRKS